MNLAECLSNADIATLRAIADTYDLSCSRHSKLALMQDILFLFRGKKFLAKRIDEWKMGYEEVFLRLGLESRQVYSSEELTGMFRRCCANAETALLAGVRQGWLYPTTRESGRLQYCVPKEIHAVLQDETVRSFYQDVDQSDQGPLTYQEVDYALQRDADLFLQYVSRHEIQLTTGGSMYKRHLEKILQLFEIEETPLEGGWRFGYGRRFFDYPDRFALIYDYTYANQLIDEGRDGFLRVTDAVATWQGTAGLSRQRSLLQFYIGAYRRPIPRLPQIVRMMSLAPMEVWIASDSFLQSCGHLIAEYYYDSREDVWAKRMLAMLCHLGVIRLGEDENGRTWFQTTKLGQQLLTPGTVAAVSETQPEARRVLIVQPNFEIFAVNADPLVMAEIAPWTELKQSGPLQVHRITRDTVRYAIEAGKSLTAWLQYVQAHSQTPIPGNVERTLMDWEAEFSNSTSDSTDSLSS